MRPGYCRALKYKCRKHVIDWHFREVKSKVIEFAGVRAVVQREMQKHAATALTLRQVEVGGCMGTKGLFGMEGTA